MAERVPFFTLFESFQAPRQLRLLLHDACIISGALDMAGRTLEVQIESSETLPQAAQDALQQMLAQQWPALQIQSVAADGISAVSQALALQPDVLFLDIRMPGQSGLEAAAEIADSWPDAMDDSCARKEWNWQPVYNLESMTEDMLRNLQNKLLKQ